MTQHSPTIELAKELMAKPSVTPEDAGCQQLMASRLEKLGFNIESMFFIDTLNMWARKGTKKPVFCFAGHTDVVPPGDLEKWNIDPFEPTVKDGVLYGRGAADMKGSLAAMVIATERFVTAHPDHKGSIAFLITSDEEGPFINGTTRVIDTLEERNEKIDWCIVGEPSSTNYCGDVVKNGRRGSLTGELTVKGIQGHVAYPHLADNPIHAVSKSLYELTEIKWDEGNEYFPPTSFQVSNINGGTGAGNVIPGDLEVMFNFRYSTEVTAEELVTTVEKLFDDNELNYDIKWTYNGLPFITGEGTFLEAIKQSIQEVTGKLPELSTSGGTSDGRFIAPTGAQVVELGGCNAMIHKINESIAVEDLDTLTEMYVNVLERTLL